MFYFIQAHLTVTYRYYFFLIFYRWKKARLEEEGKLMSELETCIQTNEVVNPIVAERIKKFVHRFTREYVKSLGIHAVGENLVPAELGGRHQIAS